MDRAANLFNSSKQLRFDVLFDRRRVNALAAIRRKEAQRDISSVVAIKCLAASTHNFVEDIIERNKNLITDAVFHQIHDIQNLKLKYKILPHLVMINKYLYYS